MLVKNTGQGVWGLNVHCMTWDSFLNASVLPFSHI